MTAATQNKRQRPAGWRPRAAAMLLAACSTALLADDPAPRTGESALTPPLEALPEADITNQPANQPANQPDKSDGSPATEPAGPQRGAAASRPKVQPTGDLPWQSVGPVPENQRDMLKQAGIDDSHLRSLFDGEPLDDGDEQTVLMFLLRSRQLRNPMAEWLQDISLATLAADPEKHRTAVASVTGDLVRIERRTLLPELEELFRFPHYWVATIKPESGASTDPNATSHEVVVCTRNIPPGWNEKTQEPFRVQFEGFFLKTGSPEPSQQLVFVAPRLRWRPIKARASQGIRESHVLLSRHGMDMGLLDSVKQQNGRGLGKEDRAAFYEMLDAASRTTPEELKDADLKPANLGQLLVTPQEVHGDLLKLQVAGATVDRIQVDDSDIQVKHGIDHYYVIHGHLPLGDQVVRLGTDEDSPEYKNSFPITLCMTELPEWMKDVSERIASGESKREAFSRDLVVEGYFFRIWSYSSLYIEQRTPGKLQPAPLVMPVRIGFVRDASTNADQLSLVFGVGFVTLLALVCGALWWTSRRDAKVAKELHAKRLESAPSLDELEL